MYLKNKFCVLVLVALLARVFAQDTPQDNPYWVRDIIHSFGQAVKGAVSIIIFTQLMQKEVGRLVIFFARTSLVKTFSERIFSLCFGRRRGGCHAWGYPGTCTCTCTSTRFLNRRPDFDYWAVLEQLSEADKNLSYEMNKCPYSNRLPTTRGTLSWPQPSDKVVKKPTDIRHIDAIFLLYQASVKSNSEMIFCLGITKENTKFLDLEKKMFVI